jgi:hypothetical protein
MVEPFRFPSKVHGCDCIICERKGVDMTTYQEPLMLFDLYKVAKVDDASGDYSDLTADDIQQFEAKFPKHAEWLSETGTGEPVNVKKTNWHKVCVQLLKNILRDKEVKHFRNPVDTVALNIPDYPVYIKHPMDFGTIERRLSAEPCEYETPYDVISDIRMVFRNCYVFNAKGTPIWRIAERISMKFEEQLINFASLPPSML